MDQLQEIVLPEGTQISAFLGDRIIEGAVYTRNDGVKVLFNESTGKWTRLRNLSHIRIMESIDDVKAGDTVDSIIKNTLGKLDPTKVDPSNPSKMKQLTTPTAEILEAESVKNPDIKKGFETQGIKSREDIENKVGEVATAVVSERDAQSSNSGNMDKNKQILQTFQIKS